MKYGLISLALALAAASAAAQASETAAPAPAPTQAPVDPARLALAKQTVEMVWPLGTYQRMMDGIMDKMMNSMMESMFDMRLGDIVPADARAEEEAKEADPELENKTMREVMASADPHFEERMRITNKVVATEFGGLMARFEPKLRDALSRVYARKFSAEQLADLNRFFSTPTGRTYAAESLMIFVDPEFATLSMSFLPEFMKEMPAITKKMEAATAHLPPPPRPKTGEEEAAEETAEEEAPSTS